jgi:hypothetical protein
MSKRTQSPLYQASYSGGSASLAYLWAVAAATVAFMVLRIGVELSRDARLVFSTAFAEFLVLWLMLGTVFCVVAFVMAMPPVWVVYRLAVRFKIRNVVYFAASGAFAGLIFSPLYVYALPGFLNQETLFDTWRLWAPLFVLSGLCGAVAFWYKAGRYIGFTKLTY